MKSEYTAAVKQEGDGWMGWFEEIPGVHCQGKGYYKLRETLEVTLKEALELNRRDALTFAGSGGYRVEKTRHEDKGTFSVSAPYQPFRPDSPTYFNT